MSREWKPGDVAMSNEGVVLRCTFQGDPGWTYDDGSGSPGNDPGPLRPLVVIDPAKVHVEYDADDALGYLPAWLRIAADKSDAHDRQCGHAKGVGHGTILRALADQIAEQAKPPKPEEPTGLGAVVENDQGRLFVRQVDGWWRGDEPCDHNWAAVHAVRVLSEGVQP